MQGGQLREAVPHVSSPGADGDYLEAAQRLCGNPQISIPRWRRAITNPAWPSLSATIMRDGTVKDVKLLIESSGSRMLDLAWMGIVPQRSICRRFRMTCRKTSGILRLSMDYELIYQ